MITFPLWFKIFLGWGVFSIIWQTYLLLTKDKYIAKIKRLPDEKKEKKIKGNSQAIKAFKLFFWVTPVYLILVPYLFYIYVLEELFHYFVMIIITYVVTIEGFLISKSIVLEFEQNK
jgi:hypothetical protein